MTVLSVNVNKAAVLRNSRGGRHPDPLALARIALAAGCHGITVHPRPDQRHIRLDDVLGLPAVSGDAEINIEGNPFAPAREGYPGMLELVRRVAPAQVTLVPDGDGQLTSDHGFDLNSDLSDLKRQVRAFKQFPLRLSIFVDAGSSGMSQLAEMGVDRIEIYTGPFADAFARGDYHRELGACRRTALEARDAGLGVNAGHDLSQDNLDCLLQELPFIDEVSIGHALFCEALLEGLDTTVKRYLRILDRQRSAQQTAASSR
ncbi:pyridoxine 5'-phosphate synthase [Dokdonella sp.]|uniref:pyridoxine 5'-phosphate synthase n=1 Tax=Dokdonella sp. TaxID=2291710 RepID=UPI003526F2CA